MTREIMWSAALIVAACASAPDQMAAREYKRESSRIEAVERFEELQKACAHAGRSVQMDRSSSGRLPPTASELRMATCGPRNPSAMRL